MDNEKGIIAKRSLDHLAGFYNSNYGAFQELKEALGIDLWFTDHFRAYFICRNRLYRSNYDGDQGVHYGSTLNRVKKIIKELYVLLRGVRGSTKVSCDHLIISNARDENAYGNRRFHGLDFPTLHNRPLFDLKNPSENNYALKRHEVYSDALLLAYLLSTSFIKDSIRFFSQFKQIENKLEVTGDTEPHRYLKEHFIQQKTFFFLMYIKFRAFELFFKRSNIGSILLSDENSPQQRVIQCAAFSRGVKIYAFQHGNIHDLHPAYIYKQYIHRPQLPTITFTWGTYFTNLLVNKGGYNQSQVITLGRLLPFVPKKQDARLKKLSGFLLYASQPQRDQELRYQTVRDIMDVLKKIGYEKKLVIRPHPKEKNDSIYFKASTETGFDNFLIDRTTDLQTHFELCDILLVAFSTVGTEFISQMKPMIVFDYNRQDLMGWVHNKVGIPVYEKADLEKILRKNSLTVDKSINESYIQNFYLTDKSTISNLKESIGAN